MNEAEAILVIIVSAVLTIFLIVAIVVLVLVAKLVKTLKRIVERAEQVVDSAEEAAAIFKHVSGPLAFFKLVRNILSVVDKMQKSRK